MVANRNQLEKDNTSIAEYLKLEKTFYNKSDRIYKYKTVNDEGVDIWYEPHELKFHKDWNWLMTVVAEISRDSRHNENEFLIGHAMSSANIDEAFNVVVGQIGKFEQIDIDKQNRINNALIASFYVDEPGKFTEKSSLTDYSANLALYMVANKILNGYSQYKNSSTFIDLISAGATYDIKKIYSAVIAFIKMYNRDNEI